MRRITQPINPYYRRNKPRRHNSGSNYTNCPTDVRDRQDVSIRSVRKLTSSVPTVCVYRRKWLSHFLHCALRRQPWSTKSCHDMTCVVTVFQLRSPLGGDAYIRSPSWPSPDLEYHIKACPRPKWNRVAVPSTVRGSSYTTTLTLWPWNWTFK